MSEYQYMESLKSQYTEKGKYLIDLFLIYLDMKETLNVKISNNEKKKEIILYKAKIKHLYFYILKESGLENKEIADKVGLSYGRASHMHQKGRIIFNEMENNPFSPAMTKRMSSITKYVDLPFNHTEYIKKELNDLDTMGG